MPDLQQIGRALQGFGAGVAGRGPQFIAGLQEQEQKLDEKRRRALLQDAFTIQQQIAAKDFEGALGTGFNRLEAIGQLGGNPADTEALLSKMQSGDWAGALNDVSTVVEFAQAEGLLPGTARTASQREFAGLTKGLSPEDLTSAQRIKLGLDPRAGISAPERIAADEELTRQVAASEGARAGARETGKLGAQLKFKPAIKAAVTAAEKVATAKGETLTALARSEAALPGLTDAVTQLRELASVATSTFGGRVFDAAVKETGFGSTAGATSRAKFIAIINNQVLPLLKETFGAAFTFQEGESLKATMGDPDATPEEKMVQLDAFIAQKQRDIQTRQGELGALETLAQPAVIEVDF